jgi:two-component system, LytTR family, response regulator
VFVTANDEHALRAFEVGAVDYLLKPYTMDRFDRVLQRARERMAGERRPPERAAPARESDARAFLQRLLITVNGRAQFVATDAIDRIESERNYVSLFSGNVKHRVRATIGALERRLDPARFMRINRSTLVRLDAVRDMRAWSHGDYRVVLHDGTELIWSRRYRADAQERFGLKE